MNKNKHLARSAKPDRGISAQTYAEHIAGVIERSKNNVSTMARYFLGNAQLLAEELKSAAIFHDLGKLDEENQKILRKVGGKKLPIHHQDAGVAQLRVCNRNEAALFVYGHHIGLCSVTKEATRIEEMFRDESVIDNSDIETVFEHTNRHLEEYLKVHESCSYSIPHCKDIQQTGWSALTRRLAFSCLVDADYGDASHHYNKEKLNDKIKTRWDERILALDKYVTELSKESAEPARNKQRQEVYKSCCNADMESGINACDSPVGTGKTTAVMAYLLRVAKERNLRHIFVVLPYTNIIKQSVEVYRQALKLPGENQEEVIAEHHHQADFSEKDLRQYAALWTAPIIVTTAVQFFETLSSNHPSKLRKLHELPGSAVFIDEAHAAIPTFLWPQAWRWIKELSCNWGCSFVLASGSLPRFWQNDKVTPQPEDVSFLLSDKVNQEVHSTERERIIYQSHEKNLSADELIDFVCSKPGPRLVILNTVQSAAVFASKMRKQGKDALHLSTALTPMDRNEIVKLIEKRLKNKKDTEWTLVATSCVEAGMDFSFATAFRQSSSTASLIQIGGRVNRHREREIAEVWDFRVTDSLMPDNPQFATSQNVLRKLFEENVFNSKNATEITSEAMRLELMSDFGEFSIKAEEIKNSENTNDFPEVAKLARVIDADTRTVIITKKVADDIERNDKVKQIDLILNSVQIRYYKLNSSGFKDFCKPIHRYDELYCWTGKYDSNFIGYMEAIVPLLELDANSLSIV